MRFYLIILIAVLSLAICSVSAHNITKVIDDLLIGYDRRLRPNYGAGRVNVGVSMYILSIHSFSDNDMEFTMEFYFRQYWNDSRLKYSREYDHFQVEGSSELAKSIWVPDTFFLNEKESFLYTMTTKNKFIKINSNGNVMESMRISATFSCPMDFKNFPMDKQTCKIPLESYGYKADEVKFHWHEDHQGNNSTFHASLDQLLPLHKVTGHRNYPEIIEVKSAKYSRLIIEFDFQRLFGYYLTQIYIPCLMLVILSWLTFFLNKNAFTIRAVICGIILLGMIFGLSMFSQNVPKTSYTKCLDIYTGICMTLAFLAVVEFALISNCEHLKDSTKPHMADKIMRFFYPIFFIVYTAICWYLSC